MNGSRYVHDTLELAGWDVEICDAQKVKGLAPLACKTDRIDAWVLAELARIDLASSGLPRGHHERTKQRLGRQRGSKVPAARSRASSPRRSGTCSHTTNRSHRRGPTPGL
jgi:hypothetical protein